MELENGVSFSSVLCGNKRRMSAANKCIGSAPETQEEPQNLKSNNSNTTRKLYQGSLTISKKYTFIIKKSGSCAKNNNKIGVAKTSEVRKLRSSQKMAAWCTFLPALISLLLTSSFLLQPAFSQGKGEKKVEKTCVVALMALHNPTKQNCTQALLNINYNLILME